MSKTRSVWLQEITWQEVAQYLLEDDIALFPVGSTEQHGPAGPLGVDSYAAIALAEAAARKAGVLVAPPLWFGDSPHHLGFPGTISLRTEVLAEVVKDVVRSLARHGFRKILIINGHKSANLPGLITACRYLHEFELPDVMMVLADPMYLARGIAGIKEAKEHHAGDLEISHVMHAFPGLVREDRLTEGEVPLKSVLSPLSHDDLLAGGGDSVEVFWNSREQKAFAPDGSFSRSAAASAEKGRVYHEYMVERLLEVISWLRAYSGPVGACAGPAGTGAAGGSEAGREE